MFTAVKLKSMKVHVSPTLTRQEWIVFNLHCTPTGYFKQCSIYHIDRNKFHCAKQACMQFYIEPVFCLNTGVCRQYTGIEYGTRIARVRTTFNT